MATSKVAYLVKPKIVNGVEGEAIVELRDIEIPTPGPGEILVKVEGCGICGTDVHEYRYNPFGYKEIVLGHEGTGEVIAVGEGVTVDTKGDPIKVGDKVVTSVLLCGECDYCKRYPELPNLCAGLGVYGLIEDDDAHHNNGWFAEHILVRKNSSIFVVNDKTLDERMLIEPACVCVHSWNRAKSTNIIDFSSTVLVQGCGPIGLMTIGACKAHGASQVIACDLIDEKLEIAKTMGADLTVNSREVDLPAFVRSQTDGVGADAVIDITGNPHAIRAGLKAVRKGGIFVSVGLPDGEVGINLTEDIIYREVIYTGVSGRLMFETWEDCMNILQSPGFSLEPVVGGIYPFRDFEQALDALKQGVPGKMILVP